MSGCDYRQHVWDLREFLKMTTVGVPGATTGSLAFPRISRSGISSRVVCVKGAGAITGMTLNAEVVNKMVEKGLCAFARKSSVADAWKEFVSPKDIIGLKVSCMGRRMLSTHPVLTEAVIKSLIAAGIDENNIIVWDRFAAHMQDVGYKLKRGARVKYIASEGGPNPVGYDQKVAYESNDDDEEKRDKTAGTKSYVTKIVTERITAIINLPVMKNHAAAGVTLSLKNLGFGSTNNNARFHIKHCDPFIGEACTMPELKGKLRLNILDAIEGCFDGGPVPRTPNQMWQLEMLYVATDMVALDSVVAGVIDSKRLKNRLPPATPLATHIATAAKLKLGTNIKDEIKVENITV